MKRLFVLMAAGGALAVAGCDDPVGGEPETYEPPMEEPAAPAAADAGAPAEATVPADPPPPVDPATLPADKRSSEESVQPDSETLFY